MSQFKHRHYLLLMLAIGLGACSADKGEKDVSGGGGDNEGGNDGNGGESNGNANADAGGNGNNGNGGDGSTVTCFDVDGDGFGTGCPAGPDCNDANPELGGYEICDGKDNDCDGIVDEFLTDVCVACDAQCSPSNEPPNDIGWTPIAEKAPGDVEDVIVDKDGALTLDRDEAQAHSVWVANTEDLADNTELPNFARGSVSKLDSKTNRELARYITVLPKFKHPGTGLDIEFTDSELGSSRPKPSRSAVDQNFDAYVANRAYDNINSVGTITKYANDEKDCIDRNMNGVIDTSRDINMDGAISTIPADGEFLGVSDECILWSAKVGTPKDPLKSVGIGSWPRALAIGVADVAPDRNAEIGDVYVGLNGSNDNHAPEICRLDAKTSELVACTSTGSFRSYGGATAPDGRLWWASRDGSRGIGVLDANNVFTQINDMPQCGTKDAQPYGVTTDAKGRVYVAMSNCDSDNVFRYEPSSGMWLKLDLPGEGGTGRGVAASPEHLWVAISGSGTNDWNNANVGRLEQFDLETLTHLATHNMPNGRGPVGVGVSFDGSIWAINQRHGGTADPIVGDVGVATRLDLSIPNGTDGHWVERAVGEHPYTYSDFIGFGLNTFADPKGFYRFIVEGCLGQTTNWRGVQVDAETPTGTSVKINVRSAGSKEALATAEWHGPYDPPAAFTDVPSGAVLEVEVVLATDDQSVAPRVFGVEIVKECATIIQ